MALRSLPAIAGCGEQPRPSSRGPEALRRGHRRGPAGRRWTIPRNETYSSHSRLARRGARLRPAREGAARASWPSRPTTCELNLDLAELLQDEGKFPELNDRMRTVAGLTNWSHEAMAGIVQYYRRPGAQPDAAIAFLEARAKIDPKAGELIYSLAALDASVGRQGRRAQISRPSRGHWRHERPALGTRSIRALPVWARTLASKPSWVRQLQPICLR